MDLSAPVTSLPGIGLRYQTKLNRLGIATIEDLLEHYPVKYIDRTKITLVRDCKSGQDVTLKGLLVCKHSIRTRSGKTLQTGLFTDKTGHLHVTWFNQPYLKTSLKTPQLVNTSGKVSLYQQRPTLVSPLYELQSRNSTSLHTGRIVPQYSQTAGVSSRWLRQKIHQILNQKNYFESDWFPQSLCQAYGVLPLHESLKNIHFPNNFDQLESATNSLSFRELFLYQLSAQLTKSEWSSLHQAPAFKVQQLQTKEFIQSFPFTLTSSQQKAVEEILTDLQTNQPMHRLLQGDVGSGKTAVAAVAAFQAYTSRKITVFMAPTEVLALQHVATLKHLFKSTNATISVQTKSQKNSPNADIIVGTHALLHRRLPDNIGLVIVDEQHRFGVVQRQALINLGKHTPHTLSLTATPIPRTLALTLYAQLDLTRLSELPPGRIPVITRVVDSTNRPKAYRWIKDKLSEGGQAFIVCPLVEESLDFKLDQVKSATAEYEHLRTQVFPEIRIGLIHGKLSSKAKNQALNDFKAKKLQILVATPVIEVGVDIPAATIMVIESAERFGLATLHQLRGRVGRGNSQSYCLLFASNRLETNSRLKHLENLHDGQRLAELDMRLRGPGNLFGSKQSGFIHTKLANLTDTKLITRSYQAAQDIINSNLLKTHPLLRKKLEALLEKNSLEA
jgi:ATP-dependent DNA helicase RecG